MPSVKGEGKNWRARGVERVERLQRRRRLEATRRSFNWRSRKGGGAHAERERGRRCREGHRDALGARRPIRRQLRTPGKSERRERHGVPRAAHHRPDRRQAIAPAPGGDADGEPRKERAPRTRSNAGWPAASDRQRCLRRVPRARSRGRRCRRATVAGSRGARQADGGGEVRDERDLEEHEIHRA